MSAADQIVAQGVPESLWEFIRASCRLPFDAFQLRSGPALPEPARGLLHHARDMTSTLAEFHASPLRVEVLQSRRSRETYLREVFLRTTTTDQIVEYGVLAVALDQFTPAQRAEIEAGRMPLGALLHRFQISFVSAPVAFFAASAASLAATPFAAHATSECCGRLNRLSRSTGEPLAWILEILPPP